MSNTTIPMFMLLSLAACSSAPPAPESSFTSSCPDEAACKQACDAGDEGGCARAAALAPQGSETPESRAIRLCGAGDANACYDAGVVLRDGKGRAADPAAAVHDFERACMGGNGPGCAALAAQLDAGMGVPQDRPRAQVVNDKACGLRVGTACFELAKSFEDGRAGTTNPAKAAAAYRAACGLGQTAACYRAGQMGEQNLGLPADTAQVFEWYVAGWTGGDRDCTLAASRLRVSGKVSFAKDAAEWDQKLYEAACTLDDQAACVERGFGLRQGGAADVARAASLGEIACGRGFANGCNLAGLIAFGVTGDLAKAEGFYGRGCTAGSKEACANQGLVLAQCAGGPCDQAKGRQLLQTACAERIDFACGELAAILRKGGAKDKAAAAAVLDRACELGNAAACYEAGVGTANAGARRGYFERGCTLGNQISCFQLAQMLDNGEGGAADKDKAEGLMGAQCQPVPRADWGDACTGWCATHADAPFCR